jgi:hypothetical protein
MFSGLYFLVHDSQFIVPGFGVFERILEILSGKAKTLKEFQIVVKNSK